jgi:glycerophosphoryl diester phosphodiesterase
MLKVHIWLPHGNMVGHASLSFGRNYISFWPADGADKKDIKVKRSHPSAFVEALYDDIQAEGNRKPKTIVINKFNHDSLETFILSLQRKAPRYQLMKYNCSNVVADCLKVACGKDPSFKPTAADYGKLGKILGRGVWTPREVLRYATELASQTDHQERVAI